MSVVSSVLKKAIPHIGTALTVMEIVVIVSKQIKKVKK